MQIVVLRNTKLYIFYFNSTDSYIGICRCSNWNVCIFISDTLLSSQMKLERWRKSLIMQVIVKQVIGLLLFVVCLYVTLISAYHYCLILLWPVVFGNGFVLYFVSFNYAVFSWPKLIRFEYFFTIMQCPPPLMENFGSLLNGGILPILHALVSMSFASAFNTIPKHPPTLY